MIRDRIVAGITDRKLSERMQLDVKLTLEKATPMERQSEVVKEQAATLHGNREGKVDRVGLARRPTVPHGNRKVPSKQVNKPPESEAKQCSFCGYPQHTSEKCPA
ncbi:hypothetical protein HPB50_014706 [Hyalomma asiaticum]|uniref:Uncharacterized protein n=1 Tax=Hyalomma asiaticum TaxID=266040 RepID=A0ACB7THQ8_HYAAI|nr:hypothetical protein HPB50_014706 [Hyalomma asiaticum]